MAIKVVHTKVSTIPDGDDSSLIRPSDWNADHSLEGLGTMAEQNANSVAITGGTISGVTVSGYIPSTEKGAALGVATLDAGGKVPVSQIPALGDLNYQGTWNATTNTPTLTSSVGTKGYYYVVSVAGTTNLNGITDWQIGDWAVYNGSAWQKIDNTDAVTSVNGYTGTVVLTQADISGTANAPTNTNITSMTGVTGGISSPDFIQLDTAAAASIALAKLRWNVDSATAAFGIIDGTTEVNIGEQMYAYVTNAESVTITAGQAVYLYAATGNRASVKLASNLGDSTSAKTLGLVTQDITAGATGFVTTQGVLAKLDTSAFTEGATLYLGATAGSLTATKPKAPNHLVYIGVVERSNAGNGQIYVRPQNGYELDEIHDVQINSPANGQTILYDATTSLWKNANLTAGTAISVTNGAASVTIANTAPDQTVVLNAGTGISTSGTYPNFTITNTSPSSGGTVTSVTGTSPISVATGTTTPAISISQAGASTNGYLSSTDWNTFNNKQPAGTYVTSVSGTTGRITSSGGTTPAIDLASGVATPGTTGSSTLIPVVTIDTYGRVTGITTAANPQGTVTSVAGTGTVNGITLTGTVTSSGSLTLGGTLDLSSPPAIGGTTPAAITGTTITATKFVGVSGGTF